MIRIFDVLLSYFRSSTINFTPTTTFLELLSLLSSGVKGMSFCGAKLIWWLVFCLSVFHLDIFFILSITAGSSFSRTSLSTGFEHTCFLKTSHPSSITEAAFSTTLLRRTGCMTSIINVIPSSLLFPANDFGPMNISLDQLSLPNSGVKRILFRVTTLFCWVAFCLMVLFLFVRGNFNGLDFPVNLAFSRPLVHLQTPSDQLSLLTSGEKRADGGWTIWFG